MKPILLGLALLALAACKEETAALPEAVQLSATSQGHYCQMLLLEHPGPKGQVHLEGEAEPLFFSQVRDAIAYRLMPEQSHSIRVIYVTDMGAAPSWEDPGPGIWIAADSALYVVGSSRIGGMGAPELVPFSDATAAAAFAASHGGQVQRLDEIAEADILGPADPHAGHGAPDEGDFTRRLRALSDQTGG